MLTFKLAQSGDSKLILKYIRDLAIAEEFPFEVSVTLSDIEANLLGKDATAKALILQVDEKPCGFAVYYYTFSTTTGKRGLHLDDLYIEPEFQGNGIGKKNADLSSSISKRKRLCSF